MNRKSFCFHAEAFGLNTSHKSYSLFRTSLNVILWTCMCWKAAKASKNCYVNIFVLNIFFLNFCQQGLFEYCITKWVHFVLKSVNIYFLTFSWFFDKEKRKYVSENKILHHWWTHPIWNFRLYFSEGIFQKSPENVLE